MIQSTPQAAGMARLPTRSSVARMRRKSQPRFQRGQDGDHRAAEGDGDAHADPEPDHAVVRVLDQAEEDLGAAVRQQRGRVQRAAGEEQGERLDDAIGAGVVFGEFGGHGVSKDAP
jgi:hypothetical protein